MPGFRSNGRPRLIRVTELAELLGVSPWSIKSACAAAGVPLVKVRRVILGVLKAGGPLYLTIESAAQIADAILGKTCDAEMHRRLSRLSARQDNAFGPNVRLEVANGGS